MGLVTTSHQTDLNIKGPGKTTVLTDSGLRYFLIQPDTLESLYPGSKMAKATSVGLMDLTLKDFSKIIG